MSTDTLYVSFWSILLDNLPDGTFTRRSLKPAEAKRLIRGARKTRRLLCVSNDDLLAPYNKRKQEDQETLCRVLKDHFGIEIAWEDFTSKEHPDKEGRYFVNPLACAEVKGKDRLLVVTCCYSMVRGRGRKKPAFVLAPDTAKFYMFEAERRVK
jgi:hypothetical protein